MTATTTIPRCALAVWLAAGVCACNDDRVFIGDEALHQVALDQDTPAAFTSDDGDLYIVETRIELPILQPSDMSVEGLREGARALDDYPYRRLPWVARGDLELEIDFTLSNLDDREREVAVIVNGINEFHEYRPGVTVIDDTPTPDFSQWERLYKLEPLERLEHTIREEELDEVAVDLATVINGAPNPQLVVYFENKSSSDERSQPYIPEVVPGLVGVYLGLRATEPGRIVLEATLRVREAEDRLADPDQAKMRLHPEAFMPSSVLEAQ